MKKKELLGIFCAAFSAMLFGSVSLMAKGAYALGSNAFTLVFGRYISGAAVVGLWILLDPKRTIRVNRRQFLRLLPVSLLFSSVPLLLYSSFLWIDTGLATTVHYIYPVVVMGISAIVFHVRPGARDLVCTALCMGGILLLYQPGGTVSTGGLLIALLSGVLFAVYVVCLDHSGLRELPALTVTFWLALLSAFWVGAAAAVSGNLQLGLPPQVWIYYALLGVVAMVAGTTLFQIGVRLCGGVKTTLFSTLEPVTSVVIGLVVFHEELRARSLIGIGLILLAVLLLALPAEKLRFHRKWK